MAFGRQLSQGSAVFVDVKGNSKFLPGIVRYKGVLPPIPGTWFGVELIVSTLALFMYVKLCCFTNGTKGGTEVYYHPVWELGLELNSS